MIRWFYIISFAFLFGCDTTSNVQPPNKNYFIKYFGGDGNQTAKDLIVNKDGTFFILGNSIRSDGATRKVYLAKANAVGELISHITYGVDMDARDFVLTSDGKIAVVANKNVSSSNADILLTRFTTDLVPLDSLVLFTGLTNGYSEYANSITELLNTDFIVEGYTLNNTNPFQELHIKVYNQTPLLKAGPEWLELSGQGSDNRGVKTLQHNSTSFYTFGTTNATFQGPANKKFWVYSLPSNGSGTGNSDYSMFEKAGAGLENSLTDVVKVAIGGYLLVGISASTTYGLKAAVTNSTDTTIVFSSAGVFRDLLLQDLGSDNGNGVAPPFATAYSSVNNYNLILANIYDTKSTSDILLMKVRNDLSKSWEGGYVQFGGDGDDTAAAVSELTDGHIMVLGTMQLGNPPAQSKIALMKLNSSGKLAD